VGTGSRIVLTFIPGAGDEKVGFINPKNGLEAAPVHFPKHHGPWSHNPPANLGWGSK